MKAKILTVVLVAGNIAAAAWLAMKRGGGGGPPAAAARPADAPPQTPRPPDAADPSGIAGDGLRNPSSIKKFQTDGAAAAAETFAREEIQITRTRFENGAAHGYYEYVISLNGTDITPPGFRTIEGADCALQKIRFAFVPKLSAVKISRPWRDSWITPTMATKTTYELRGGRLEITSATPLREICDVSELL